MSAPPRQAAPPSERRSKDGFAVRYDVASLAGDPIAGALLRDEQPPRTTLRLALERLIEPGCRLLDVGAHVGATALPAAAAGAHVVAVEPDPRLAEALRASVAASRLGGSVEVVEAAAADRAGSLVFSPAGPWGHVRKRAEADDVEERLHVTAVTGDELIARAGWNELEIIKLSVNGFECQALDGLRQVLRPRRLRRVGRLRRRPLLVLDSSAHALSWYAETPATLRERLARDGFTTYLVDWRRPDRLVPLPDGAVQPDCGATLVCARQPEDLTARGWTIKPFASEELLERMVTACRHASATERWHAARELEQAPCWLREEPGMVAALGELNLDPSPMVRDAAMWSDRTQPGDDDPDRFKGCPRMRTVALPDGTPATFALPAHADTPIARDLLASEEYPLHAANRLLLAAAKPGIRLLDLGAHLGTFAIPAALLGMEVIAVEPHPEYADLLERSIAENDLGDRVTLVRAAAGDREGRVELVCEFEWSFLRPDANRLPGRRGESRRVSVPVVPAGALLGRAGWDGADLVKMDLEGYEVRALAGMEELLARADAPPVLFESNAPMLHMHESSVGELLATFERHGYANYLLAHEDGEWWLVPVAPDDFQVEASEEVLAVKGAPPELPGWVLRDPMSREEQVERVRRVAEYPWRNYRRLLAERLRDAPSWLLAEPLIAEALELLCNDADADVREAAAWSARARS